MEEFNLLSTVAAGLAAAFVGGVVARSIRLSPVVGYLAAGVLIGPFTPGYDAETEPLQALAELGVIFLMFGVGLHFNLRDLLSVKKIAIPGALAQIVLATALTAGIGLAFGLPGREALVLGLATSIASTVVLIRSLEERGLVEPIHGRVAIGWLVFEDLATIVTAFVDDVRRLCSSGTPQPYRLSNMRSCFLPTFIRPIGCTLAKGFCRHRPDFCAHEKK